MTKKKDYNNDIGQVVIGTIFQHFAGLPMIIEAKGINTLAYFERASVTKKKNYNIDIGQVVIGTVFQGFAGLLMIIEADCENRE